ncbi:hypothetical protein N9H39_00245 [Gammaproteobacteria bacterium]|nr:hypothetical protein [Gammaproteobacteria bacterium]
MDKTARDLILELYKDDHITKGETNLLLDAINKPPQTVTVPYNTGTITQKPDWTYDPYRPGQPWYTTTGTDNTQLTTKDTTNG